MRKYIIASHGGLATGMKSAVEMIIGTCGNIECYDLNTYSTPQKIYDAILERTELLNQFICDVRMSYTMYEHKRIFLVEVYIIN